MFDLLLLFGLVLLPSFISFLLSKAKFRVLKYLSPLACLLIMGFFYLEYINLKCDPDAVESWCPFQNVGNSFLILFFEVAFIISLIWCVLEDISPNKAKKTSYDIIYNLFFLCYNKFR